MVRRKKILTFFILLSVVCNSSAQYNGRATMVLAKLDSLRNGLSVSKHFASIYYLTTERAIQFFSAADSNTQIMMDRFEKSFADYFFRSVHAYDNNSDVPYEWKAYYHDTSAPALRYMLFGINAHINGDLWQAMTSAFSLEEFRAFIPHYYLYQKGLIKNYQLMYDYAIGANKKIKLFHSLSFGLDKWYGRILFKRWRKRQVQLAELYYTDKALFVKKLKKVHGMMNRLNDRIRRNI